MAGQQQLPSLLETPAHAQHHDEIFKPAMDLAAYDESGIVTDAMDELTNDPDLLVILKQGVNCVNNVVDGLPKAVDEHGKLVEELFEDFKKDVDAAAEIDDDEVDEDEDEDEPCDKEAKKTSMAKEIDDLKHQEIGKDVFELCSKVLQVTPKIRAILTHMEVGVKTFKIMKSRAEAAEKVGQQEAEKEKTLKVAAVAGQHLQKAVFTEEINKELEDIKTMCKALVEKVKGEETKLQKFKNRWSKAKQKWTAGKEAMKEGGRSFGWGLLGLCGAACVGAGLLIGVTVVTCGTAAPITAAIGAHLGVGVGTLAFAAAVRGGAAAAARFDEVMGEQAAAEEKARRFESALAKIQQMCQKYESLKENLNHLDQTVETARIHLSQFVDASELSTAVDLAKMDVWDMVLMIDNVVFDDWLRKVDELKRQTADLEQQALKTYQEFMSQKS